MSYAYRNVEKKNVIQAERVEKAMAVSQDVPWHVIGKGFCG